MVVAASGSVGETIAPSANAAAHGRPSMADEVGVQLHVGHARREPDQAAAEHQQDRIGHAQHAGERREHGDGDEQEQDDELDVLHVRVR